MKRVRLNREILEDRVIAIARRVPRDRLADVADILVDCGIRSVEVTLDSADALAAIGSLSASGHVVGAGTVRRVDQVAAVATAGAKFLVSPHTDPDIVSAARAHGLPVMAGALTPTEVVRAWDLGVSAVKLFPASVADPGFLRTVRGPLSDIQFVPTGGIDADNAGSFLEAGAVAVGVGGWLTSPEDLDVVRERASALIGAVSTNG